jgi:hypothetical protein
MCSCGNAQVARRAKDRYALEDSLKCSCAYHWQSDEEDRDVFDFAREEVITHRPDDDLHNLSIPMKPDRVVGLRITSRIPHDDSYFPVTGKRILLPFLVVEAKREDDAPGFRSIQYQTAFPIRRFLTAQEELFNKASADWPKQELCLVWFFAYQGEQWRLNACIRKGRKVVSGAKSRRECC